MFIKQVPLEVHMTDNEIWLYWLSKLQQTELKDDHCATDCPVASTAERVVNYRVARAAGWLKLQDWTLTDE